MCRTPSRISPQPGSRGIETVSVALLISAVPRNVGRSRTGGSPWRLGNTLSPSMPGQARRCGHRATDRARVPRLGVGAPGDRVTRGLRRNSVWRISCPLRLEFGVCVVCSASFSWPRLRSRAARRPRRRTKSRPRSFISELRLGLLGHHVEPAGSEKGGQDVNVEILFGRPAIAYGSHIADIASTIALVIRPKEGNSLV